MSFLDFFRKPAPSINDITPSAPQPEYGLDAIREHRTDCNNHPHSDETSGSCCNPDPRCTFFSVDNDNNLNVSYVENDGKYLSRVFREESVFQSVIPFALFLKSVDDSIPFEISYESREADMVCLAPMSYTKFIEFSEPIPEGYVLTNFLQSEGVLRVEKEPPFKAEVVQKVFVKVLGTAPKEPVHTALTKVNPAGTATRAMGAESFDDALRAMDEQVQNPQNDVQRDMARQVNNYYQLTGMLPIPYADVIHDHTVTERADAGEDNKPDAHSTPGTTPQPDTRNTPAPTPTPAPQPAPAPQPTPHPDTRYNPNPGNIPRPDTDQTDQWGNRDTTSPEQAAEQATGRIDHTPEYIRPLLQDENKFIEWYYNKPEVHRKKQREYVERSTKLTTAEKVRCRELMDRVDRGEKPKPVVPPAPETTEETRATDTQTAQPTEERVESTPEQVSEEATSSKPKKKRGILAGITAMFAAFFGAIRKGFKGVSHAIKKADDRAALRNNSFVKWLKVAGFLLLGWIFRKGIKDLLASLWNRIVSSPLYKDFMNFLNEHPKLKAAIETIGKVVNVIKTFVQETIWPFLEEVIKWVKETLWPTLKSVFDWIGKYIWPALRDTILPWIGKIAKFLFKVFEVVIEGIMKGIGTAIAWILDGIAWVLSKFGMSSKANNFKSAAKDLRKVVEGQDTDYGISDNSFQYLQQFEDQKYKENTAWTDENGTTWHMPKEVLEQRISVMKQREVMSGAPSSVLAAGGYESHKGGVSYDYWNQNHDPNSEYADFYGPGWVTRNAQESATQGTDVPADAVSGAATQELEQPVATPETAQPAAHVNQTEVTTRVPDSDVTTRVLPKEFHAPEALPEDYQQADPTPVTSFPMPAPMAPNVVTSNNVSNSTINVYNMQSDTIR